MVIHGSYMFEFSVSKDMRKKKKKKEEVVIHEVAVGRVAAQSCLTLVVEELKMSV
jgi:hypothetical protein